MLWNLLCFYSSFWASCIVAFKGIQLKFIQLNWRSVCNSKALDDNERSFVRN